MTIGGRASRLSVGLWLAFAAITVVGAVVLLRACGLLMPLTSALAAAGWSFCPATPIALSAEAERGASLKRLVDRLELELAQKTLACASIPPPPPSPLDLPTHAGPPRPQQTALLKPPTPPPSLPADRWEKKDLTLLKGCWVLGREAPSMRGKLGAPDRENNCTRKAGRICFDANGAGQNESTTVCPISGSLYCIAPVTAKFGNDGTFKATQPRVQCQGPGYWVEGELSCRRIDDNHAICRSSENLEHGFPSFEYEFRRAP